MGFLQSASEPTLVFVQIWQNAIQKNTRNSGLIIFQNVLLYCIEQKVSKDNSELLSLEQVNTETVGGSNTVQCADITWDVCMGQQHDYMMVYAESENVKIDLRSSFNYQSEPIRNGCSDVLRSQTWHKLWQANRPASVPE